MELLYKLLNSIDREKQHILGQTETEVNNSILTFYSMYVLNDGNPNNLIKNIFTQRVNGLMSNTDFVIKSLVVQWINIPFDYNKIPIDVYGYIQECSKYLVLPKRIDDVFTYGEEMKKTLQN